MTHLAHVRVTIWDINPEPWRTVGVPGRGQGVAKYGKTLAYQDALREELADETPFWDEDVPLSVTFWIWRSTSHAQPADTTNIQKATEDALQGLMIHNDKRDHHVQTFMMEQTPETRPCVVIRIEPFLRPLHQDIPQDPPPEAPRLFEGSDWEAPDSEEF